MRLDYNIINSILILLLLLLMMSAGVQAQTASSRPVSAVMTPLIRQHLDVKSSHTPVDVTPAVLPSSNGVPDVATQTKQKYSHASSGPGARMPSSYRIDLETIKNRNRIQNLPPKAM
jgi:hypothetical protein